MSHDAFAAVYERGLAVGFSSIKNDTMEFRFKDETFTVPSLEGCRVAWWNGYFYEARVADLRKIEAEAAVGG